MNKYSIDRFEDDFAVCENLDTGEFENILINELPKNISQGDIIEFKNGKYIVDVIETQKIKESIKKRVDSLWGKNN